MDFYAIKDSVTDALTRLNVASVWDVKARQEFYTLIADFIHDGVGVHEAIDEVHQRYAEKKDPRRHITQRILDDQRGAHGKVKGLGASLAMWVPATESMVIEAGERSAGVEDGLRMASTIAQVQHSIKTTVISKLTYPGVLLLMLGAFLLAINAFLIPVFEELSPREKWPTAPALLGHLADSAFLIVGVVFGLLGGVLFSFVSTKGRWVGRVRDFFDARIAPWSIYRRMTGAILMSIFALLTQAGVPFSQTLAYMEAIASDWLADHLMRMKSSMRRGASSGEAIASVLFDEGVRWKISVYGRRSNFSTALESLSKEVQLRTIERITRAAGIMRGFVYILITVMFGWVYASFLTLSFAARNSALG